MKFKILRLPQVIELTGLSRSSIYLLMSEQDFPQPISLGIRAKGWVEQEVSEWIQQRINKSRNGGKV